jgi:hypothetical protein
MQRYFLFSAVHTSLPRRYTHINHLLLFPNACFTGNSMRGDLMCPVDHTVDQFVAGVQVCPSFLPCAGTTKCASEVKIKVRWAGRGERNIPDPYACCQ